jgi:hypothetical protein
VFPQRIKWILAAVALAPKILFLGVRSLGAPPGLSFTIEPSTLATSSSLWAWSTLLAGFGVFVLYQSRRTPVSPDASAQPESQRPLLLKVVGLALIALGAGLLLGLVDGFHRIDDAGNGRWALKHAARGTIATFARDEVARIEVTENRSSRGPSRYPVRVTLTDGRTFSVTAHRDALQDLRDFATTSNLGPGRLRILPYRDQTWTSGAAGFTLKDDVGTYEHTDQRTGERSTFEFWPEGERLAGKETVLDGQNKYIRTLRNIRISDTGRAEFELTTLAEVGQPAKTTLSFSWRWSPGGETGQLTKDGFDIGLKELTRR